MSGSVPLVSQNGGDSGGAIVTSSARLSNGTLTIPASGNWSYQVIGVVHAPVSSPKLASISSLQTPDGYIHVFSSTADGYVWETWFGNGKSPVTDQLANLSG
jgi:VCBS repeat-containing protein